MWKSLNAASDSAEIPAAIPNQERAIHQMQATVATPVARLVAMHPAAPEPNSEILISTAKGKSGGAYS